MNTEHLITMANQIGSFFASYPDADEAADEIASHIKRFWAPRMRTLLLAHVAQHDGDGLSPLVLVALERHRNMLAPMEKARA